MSGENRGAVGERGAPACLCEHTDLFGRCRLLRGAGAFDDDSGASDPGFYFGAFDYDSGASNPAFHFGLFGGGFRASALGAVATRSLQQKEPGVAGCSTAPAHAQEVQKSAPRSMLCGPQRPA